MKAKILIIAYNINKEKTVITLEVSNRAITNKDLEKLYNKINTRLNWNTINRTVVSVSLNHENKTVYKTSSNIHNINELQFCITNYVSIINYEMHERLGV